PLASLGPGALSRPTAPWAEPWMEVSAELLGRLLQAQLPGFGYQVRAEAVVRLVGHKLETRLRLDVARRQQHALGPQPDGLIPSRTGKDDQVINHAPADAKPTRVRLDQKQA